MMGSPLDKPTGPVDEKRHKVTISRVFYMQTTEVTQGQWRTVMGNNPSGFKGDDRPVEKVSWNDCQQFIRRLNKKEGTDKYRLPTEAEWEYACRAGTKTPFFFGECLSTDDANYNGDHPLPGCPKGLRRGKILPVASFRANAWGLYDMHGNVWEWCNDWYGDYPSGDVADPKGTSSGSYRIVRGGSGFNCASYCLSASRTYSSPADRNDFVGFRLVRITP